MIKFAAQLKIDITISDILSLKSGEKTTKRKKNGKKGLFDKIKNVLPVIGFIIDIGMHIIELLHLTS